MAKREATFDKAVWDTGVSPVARSKAKRCSVCKGSTGKRSFWVDEQVMCEDCADRSVAGIHPNAKTSSARTMLLGIAAMVVIAVVYVVMHLAKS